MSTANLDSADLKAATAGGVIREDAMNKIWEIDNIRLPFSDMCGKDTCDNSYTEWTIEELAAVNLSNKVVDGADVTGNDTKVSSRLGNHCQESVKQVRVSDRANSSDGIGDINTLAHQIAQRQKELRQDVEAISLTMQASVADDGNATAGQTAGVFGFIKTNINAGATGTHPGFNTSTKVVDAGTAGTKRALSEKTVRDIAQMVYQEGGDQNGKLYAMGRPPVVRAISEYLFSSTAKVATFMEDTNSEKGTAVGAANVFITDFGVLVLMPNRRQPTTATATSTLGIFNFEYLRQCFLNGYYVRELARTGLAENRVMAVDWCTKVLNEKSQGAIYDIDEAVAMTA